MDIFLFMLEWVLVKDNCEFKLCFRVSVQAGQIFQFVLFLHETKVSVYTKTRKISVKMMGLFMYGLALLSRIKELLPNMGRGLLWYSG